MNIVYLHGFASGPSSSKAVFFARKFKEAGIAMDIPTLDSGDFEHLTITRQLTVIQEAVAGRAVILIGSSMGGYLAALYAARRPEHVQEMILLAPAFDFGRHWPETLGAAEIADWQRTGRRKVFHYTHGRECDLSYQLIADAESYESYPNARQPALILHGREDAVVPITYSYEFASRHPNATVIELQTGHEMTDVLDRLWLEAARFLGMARSVQI